ncbi:hypothetical protein FRB96_005887 [Tulasnella sp. 330]|nr:hypothetical protein FRB96_005887 [Tulasnella sp. 330]
MPPKGKKAKAEKSKKGKGGREPDEDDEGGPSLGEDALGDNVLGLNSPAPGSVAITAADLRSPRGQEQTAAVQDKRVATTETHTETMYTTQVGETANSSRNSQQSHSSRNSQQSMNKSDAGSGSGWGAAVPRARGSAHTRTSEKVVSAGSGNFPAFEDFHVMGPATAMGGGGGGWDVASAIGTSSSVSGRSSKIKMSKSVKSANKLSTVLERSSEFADHEAPAGPVRSAHSSRALSLGSASAPRSFSQSTMLPNAHPSVLEPMAPPSGPASFISSRGSLSPSQLRDEEMKKQIELNRAQGLTPSSSFRSSAGLVTTPGRLVTSPLPMSPAITPVGEPGPSQDRFSRSQASEVGTGREKSGYSGQSQSSFLPPPPAPWTYSHGGHESRIITSLPPTMRATSASSIAGSNPPSNGALGRGSISPSAVGSVSTHPPQLYQHPTEGFGTSMLGDDDDMEEMVVEEGAADRQAFGSRTTTLRKSTTIRKSAVASKQQGRGHMSSSSTAGTHTAPPPPPPTTRPATAPAPNPTYYIRRHVSDGPTSNTLRRAMSTASVVNRPQPTHDARLQETGGLALKPAQRAMFGRHRHVSQRFFWTLPPEHDERVEGLLNWVAVMGWGLGNLGLSKFLQWRMRGALFANADFRPWKSPDEPAFDWLTFEECQNTLDRTLQESIATYDPNTTVLVFVFLVSKSGSSVGIWRRKVPIPPSLQIKHNTEIESVKKEIARTKPPVLRIEARPSEPLPELPPSPPPPMPKGKRRWYLFFAREKVKPPKQGQDAVTSRTPRARR